MNYFTLHIYSVKYFELIGQVTLNHIILCSCSCCELFSFIVMLNMYTNTMTILLLRDMYKISRYCLVKKLHFLKTILYLVSSATMDWVNSFSLWILLFFMIQLLFVKGLVITESIFLKITFCMI